MDLKVIINSSSFNERANFFLVVQIDELILPEKQKKNTKFRTEVSFNSANPIFKRNIFNFEGLSYGNRLTLKIGCFNTRLSTEPDDMRRLLDNSQLKCTTQLTLTVKMLHTLRHEGQLQNDMIFYDENQHEVGRISMTLRHSSHDLVAQIDEDVDRVKKLYYDPYETDKDIIKDKLAKVEQWLQKKSEDYNQALKKVQFIRTAHKQVSYDQANLKNLKEQLELQNDKMRGIVERKNDVKELHIQIDLLKNTDQGQTILMKKLSLLLKKFEFEKHLYEELSSHYYQIEANLQESKNLEKEVLLIKETLKEQEFIIQRCQDQIPQVKNLHETIRNQEGIIINLQDQIKSTMKENNRIDSKELQYNLEKLRNDREILKQKQQQLQGLKDMNRGELPMEVYNKFKNDSYVAESPALIQKFKKRAEMLLKELELISGEIDNISQKNHQKQYQLRKMDSSEINDIDILKLEIEQAENKAEILEEQMMLIARNYAKEIGQLKGQLSEIESELQMHQGLKTQPSQASFQGR